ncbi:MAG: TAT-variant-translocated molybdopterin oxidoreductase [Bacteroidota bacterium]
MKQPKHWIGLEQLENSPVYHENNGREFPTDISLEDSLENTTEESLNVKASRRDFMKLMGFGITAATLSACAEGALKKAIPYVEKPGDIIPGVANWYASTSPTGNPVLVKTREGRPIKIEGNLESEFNQGGTSAIDQATVLNLYDMDRAKNPKRGDGFAAWGDIDKEIIEKLGEIAANGGKVRVLSKTINSPSTRQLIEDFLEPFGENGTHVTYDALSASAISKAHEMDFGVKAIPSYELQKAKVIASFSCDFLGGWISPVELSHKYTAQRSPDWEKNPDPSTHWMSRHFQIESIMSLTGANADLRFPIEPYAEGAALLSLFNKVARILGRPTLPGVSDFNVAGNQLDKIAQELAACKDPNTGVGSSLVICGTNDVATQQVVNGLNEMLGNYGSTIDLANPFQLRQGDDEAMAGLVAELGDLDALILYNANPVYETPYAAEFEAALKNIGLTISFAQKADESAIHCGYHTPDHNFLESWGDATQNARFFSLQQPVINPIYSTRQAQDSLLKWSGSESTYLNYLKQYWRDNHFSSDASDQDAAFRAYWNDLVRRGVMHLPLAEVSPTYDGSGMAQAASALTTRHNNGSGLSLVAYEKVAQGDGTYANNPWLQEMSDPITRIAWDDYLTVSVAYATENNLEEGQYVDITVPGLSEPMTLPVMIQPGQAMNTLALALGYGRTAAGKVAEKSIGANAYTITSFKDGAVSFTASGASISPNGADKYEFPKVQTHDLLYDPKIGRLYGDDFDRTDAIVKEAALGYYKDKSEENNPFRESLNEYKAKKKHLVSLWESHFKDPQNGKNIHWAMAIDLNKCTGCGACVVSCQAENNIPVVGKDEVRRRREMHWIRIDRYYSGSPDNPDVVFQPMMCQHCDNAPCETVCPVLATIHSNEGLNQMTYNRCVGTRYCANNCPYKVRRFNWLNYTNTDTFKDINPAHESNPVGRLVLNPDVTVRFRGVMEKCTFCVQRLQEAKLRAKIKEENSYAKPDPNDRMITACMSACPTGGIIFGDRNDPESEISKLWHDQDNERKYLALEEVKTLSSVAYMTLVRNRTKEEWDTKNQEKEELQTY